MPFRKLAGFDKNGKVWVADVPERLQKRLRVHESTFQRLVLKGVPRKEAIRRANRAEVKGLSFREGELYNLDLARRTKGLPERVSYSPFRKVNKK